MSFVPLAVSPDTVTLAFGVVLVLAALVYLYGEVRAFTTDHHSFAVDPEEPEILGSVRHGLAWIFIVFGLVVGSFMLYLALAV